MASSSSSSSSSPSPPADSFAWSVPRRDLSHLLQGEDPAQLLLAIEQEELRVKQAYHLLSQELEKVKKEEQIIREKLQQQQPS